MVKSPKRTRTESAEDWMQVLDDFLDNHHDDTNLENEPNSTNGETHHDHDKSIIPDKNFDMKGAQEEDSKQKACAKSSDKLGGFDDEGSITDEQKKILRSERKRHREKQRRNDVNSHFTRLSELLKRIEEDSNLDSDVSDDEDETQVKKKKAGGFSAAAINTPANRAALIARSVEILDRLNQVNKSLRSCVKDTRRQMKKMQALDDKRQVAAMEMKQQYTNNANSMMNGQFGGMMMMMPNMNMTQASSNGQPQQPMMMMVPMMMPNQMIQNGQMMNGPHQNLNLTGNQNQEYIAQGRINDGSNIINSTTEHTPGGQMASFQNTMQHNFMGMFHPMPVPPMMNGGMTVNQTQASMHVPSNQMLDTNRQSHHSSENLMYQGSDDNSSYGGNLAHCA